MSASRLVGALITLACGQAFGTAILTDGTYHEFTYGGAPIFVVGCGPANALVCTTTTNPAAETNSTSPWTFTGAGSLFVQDLGKAGETFQVIDNGVTTVGTTSATSFVGSPCAALNSGFDIACAIANDGPTGYSSGTFLLGAGSHSITIEVLTNCNGATTDCSGETASGSAVFSLSPAPSGVPEPATYGMVGVALGGLALLRRRRPTQKQ